MKKTRIARAVGTIVIVFLAAAAVLVQVARIPRCWKALILQLAFSELVLGFPFGTTAMPVFPLQSR